jgi:hypothetical protein
MEFSDRLYAEAIRRGMDDAEAERFFKSIDEKFDVELYHRRLNGDY